MATAPPPGPRGGDRQYTRNLRDQADAMRAQARAQRSAWRMQRDVYRSQVRLRNQALRRTSLLGPLLVISIGVILLLAKFGEISADRLLELYGRWWPVLLIVAGGILLTEWIFDQSRAEQGAAIRRGMDGGTILLLLLLTVGGASAGGVMTGRSFLARHLDLDPTEMGGLLGEKREGESELDQQVPVGARISITNPRGDVTVTGQGTDEHLHVTINKSVYALSKDEAERRLEELNPKVRLVDGSLYLELTSAQGSSADLTVTLPASHETTLTADHGSVTVSRLNAPLTITALHGDVEVGDVRGNVSVRTSNNRNSLSAHDIQGDLALRGHAEDLNLSNVSGQTSLEGEFFGDTHLEHLKGSVSFNTSRTHLLTAGISDQVDISNDANLTATGLAGPTTLRTRSRNITLNQFAGDAHVENSDGTVELTSGSQLGNIYVEDRNGAVTLNLPPHAGFVLDAEARDGHIDNNLELTSTESAQTTHLQGRLGDGHARVSLKTSHADIEIHQGLAATAAPAPETK